MRCALTLCLFVLTHLVFVSTPYQANTNTQIIQEIHGTETLCAEQFSNWCKYKLLLIISRMYRCESVIKWLKIVFRLHLPSGNYLLLLFSSTLANVRFYRMKRMIICQLFWLIRCGFNSIEWLFGVMHCTHCDDVKLCALIVENFRGTVENLCWKIQSTMSIGVLRRWYFDDRTLENKDVFHASSLTVPGTHKNHYRHYPNHSRN